jgi:hypothetical protein
MNTPFEHPFAKAVLASTNTAQSKIEQLYRQSPNIYTVEKLAKHFKTKEWRIRQILRGNYVQVKYASNPGPIPKISMHYSRGEVDATIIQGENKILKIVYV